MTFHISSSQGHGLEQLSRQSRFLRVPTDNLMVPQVFLCPAPRARHVVRLRGVTGGQPARLDEVIRKALVLDIIRQCLGLGEKVLLLYLLFILDGVVGMPRCHHDRLPLLFLQLAKSPSC